jgi:tetratricopeptide (TPR) repeat protein
MAKDWFRKANWNGVEQADFFTRLERCRTAYNKAQYLRIQASYLEGIGSNEMLKAALELLEKMFAEFPEQTQLASAYTQKASCLAKLGNIHEAIINYQLALQTEREFPQVKTHAFIDFGKLVAENRLAQFYDEALAVLGAELNSRGIQFPCDTFNAFGIRSLIATSRGQIQEAKEFAKVALEAAAKIDSGLRYHPTVGLVHDKEAPFYKFVEAITHN